MLNNGDFSPRYAAGDDMDRLNRSPQKNNSPAYILLIIVILFAVAVRFHNYDIAFHQVPSAPKLEIHDLATKVDTLGTCIVTGKITSPILSENVCVTVKVLHQGVVVLEESQSLPISQLGETKTFEFHLDLNEVLHYVPDISSLSYLIEAESTRY